MSIDIRISWSKGTVNGILKDSPTTQELIKVLPHTSKANTWGDEVYFGVPIHAKLEANAKQVVDPGTIAFWIEGGSLALPFGPTPISQGDECRLIAKVNLLGHLKDDPKQLGSIRSGERITVELT